jgi:hypothetical protein
MPSDRRLFLEHDEVELRAAEQKLAGDGEPEDSSSDDHGIGPLPHSRERNEVRIL